MKFLKTSDKFDKKQPYSGNYTPTPTRNIYALFGDGGQDLFRHGLAGITPNDDVGGNTRLSMFDETVDYSFGDGFGDLTAKEDPVMFGFDVVIRTAESPLFSDDLQDSVSNFFETIKNSGNEEMLARYDVWINFKAHFFQFFRDTLDNVPYTESANRNNPSNSRFYYYLKKISGLDQLVESNSGDSIKSFVDYGKDMIKFEFSEDVTLRVGKMAHLYKSLYWSRLNGKTMIPENLLRFDCDIVVSEVRNFVKVKKIINSDSTPSSDDLKVLKDNVNRYVYTLYECQLFFDKMPHPGEVDLGSTPDMYVGYSVGLTYKFSTLRLDNFDPIDDKYNPLNNGMTNPFSINSLDRFLNSTSTVNAGTSSSISPANSGTISPVEVDVIVKFINTTNDITSETNSDGTSGKTTSQSEVDTMNQLEGGDSNFSDFGSFKSVSEAKIAMTEKEISQFATASTGISNELNNDESSRPIDRWGKPERYFPSASSTTTTSTEGSYIKSPLGGHSTFENNSAKKKDVLDSEVKSGKDGSPKESWLDSDTPGARFAKRIANTGIALANQAITSRVALLNKAINKIGGAVLSNRILPPKNIYDNQFNGQVYTSSKQVKDAFSRFAGESISDLFKK